MKQLISLLLAGTMAASTVAVGSFTAGAADDSASGGYGVAGEYTPSAGVKTQRLLFAMPNAWQNDITQDPQCGGAAGCYWWSGYDTPDAKFGFGWPGYKTKRVNESGVNNLWYCDVPAYGNGETGDAMQIIWTNYLNGGSETDPAKNPFYAAAAQSTDTNAQWYSRCDENEKYDPLFRYIYLNAMLEEGVDGAEYLDINADTFWVDANRLAAYCLGNDWDRLSANEKTYQADILLDEIEVDYSEFGNYANNFFNEDLVGDSGGLYPYEEPMGFGQAFTFDNMVYVVDFDVKKIRKNELSGKVGMSGDFYFYYGNGNYGTWPTEELNEEMGGVTGSFTTGDYVNKSMAELMAAYDEHSQTDPTAASIPYFYPKANTIYFYAGSTDWRNYNRITLFLYDHESGDQLITWGSKKGNMTDEGNGIWSINLVEKGYPLDSNTAYGVIFTADWGAQTCDLIIGPENYGDVAYCTRQQVENSVDSNKRSGIVRWRSGAHGNPLTITAIGNVIGDECWKGETPYSLFVHFLASTGADGLQNALRFNGKTQDQTISDTGLALGLSEDEIYDACVQAGVEYSGGGSLGDFTYQGLVFSMLDDGTCELVDYNGTKADVVIPAYIKTTGKTTSSVETRSSNQRLSVGASYEEPTTEPYYYYETTAPYYYEEPTYVEVPVTRIGNWAFYNSKHLASVEIPDSIIAIGKGAFYGCPSLTEVTLPDSVTSLGANAFEKCLYLERVTLSNSLTAIEDETFFDCRRLTSVNIPSGVREIGDEAFCNCRSLKNLVLPNGTETVGTKDAALGLGVFEECRNLERLVIPASVTYIGENAVENCQKLTFCGTKGSYVQEFAESAGAPFDNIGNVTASGMVLGDANNDLDLTVIDATIMQRVLAEMNENSYDLQAPRIVEWLDVNGDGGVNISDVTMIQRFLAEYVDSFR